MFAVSFFLVALYCAAETAFTSVNRLSIKALAEAGDSRAQTADVLLADRARLVSVLLVGINVFTVLSSVLSAAFFEKTRILGSQSVILGAVGLVVLTLILAEIIPKKMAQADSIRTVLRLSPFVRASVLLFGPIAAVLGALPRWMFGRLAKPVDDLEVTHESLSEMAKMGEEQGEIDADTGDMIEGILSSGEKTARDIMTPANRVVTVSCLASLSEVTSLSHESGFSRFPVVKGPLGYISGVVHVKDAVARVFQGKPGTAEDILRPAIRVRPHSLARDVLSEMRARRQHMAVIETDDGTMMGIVTIDDLLEDLLES